MTPMLLALALAASEPATAEEIVERRAGILSGVGVAFALGGGIALGIGIDKHSGLIDAGASVLIAVALHAFALTVLSCLWPFTSSLRFFGSPVSVRRYG